MTTIGNLVADPQMRTTQSGINVCTFTVAVNKRQKGDAQGADFFRVSAWRKLGENCQRFLTKGRKVCVVGEVSVSTYTTQNGETRASMGINAQNVEFLSGANEQHREAVQEQPEALGNGWQEVDDDLPWE